MTTILIVHRWSGSPDVDWYPWLKGELEKQGVNVLIPRMPDTHHPKIDAWVSTLRDTFPQPNEKTYMVGHSIGCQAILRYIETLPEGTEIGGLFFVAPWTKLKKQTNEKPEDAAIAKPWMETPINWKKIFSRAQNTLALFSTDDPYVDSSTQSQIFRDKLNADIMIEEGMGHFTMHDQITELPVVFETLEEWGLFAEKPISVVKKKEISEE